MRIRFRIRNISLHVKLYHNTNHNTKGICDGMPRPAAPQSGHISAGHWFDESLSSRSICRSWRQRQILKLNHTDTDPGGHRLEASIVSVDLVGAAHLGDRRCRYDDGGPRPVKLLDQIRDPFSCVRWSRLAVTTTGNGRIGTEKEQEHRGIDDNRHSPCSPRPLMASSSW